MKKMKKKSEASRSNASKYPMLSALIKRLEKDGSHQRLATALGRSMNTIASWAQDRAHPNWEDAAGLIRYMGRDGWRILRAMRLREDEIDRLARGWAFREPEPSDPKRARPVSPRRIKAKHPGDPRAAIREMKEAGLTYRAIAEAMGITRQRAHQLASTPTPTRKRKP